MKNGFSLVELSIVLVILGLLTGGILGGQSLIRAAELRAVSTEYERYITAFQSFHDKYFAYPGDMPNATDFWGTAANCPGTTTQGTTDGTTCNGDGDGIMESMGGNPNTHEQIRAWQHLANAGMIEGNYNGVTGPGGGNNAVIGTNVPPSKLTGGGWSFNYMAGFGDANWYNYDYRNMLHFGGNHSTSVTVGYVLTPEEMWNIDTKMDDGMPGTGKMMSMWWTNCTLSTTNTEFDKGYDLQESGKLCAIIFPNVFR